MKPLEISDESLKDRDAIIESLEFGIDSVKIARVLCHGFKFFKFNDSWEDYIDLNFVKQKSSTITYDLATVKSNFDLLNPLGCMKIAFTSQLQDSPTELKKKSWLIICIFFKAMKGLELLTDPKHTTLLAFGYGLVLPKQTDIARVIYNILIDHKTTNHTAESMFESFVLAVRKRYKIECWLDIIFETLKQSYSSNACCFSETWMSKK